MHKKQYSIAVLTATVLTIFNAYYSSYSSQAITRI
ncbi:hypothetical protein MiSe_38430 [Microseira wollei NIES-4236]|uniref:Uncharacterized protein n=1 Tax=Microseira wollei NIES-4236 TaxID=2530354 RepID=A0AAV3XFD0_9CYAN|nr:hypothetical protein MiSe_38430 [Microseira wollei NIES-4236]